MIHLPKIKILTAAIALSMGIYNANAQATFKTTGAKIGITTGANIHVQGSVISETASTSEGEFYDNGHLSLEGNWTNNNSTGNGFEAASQVTVEFNGSTDQHIDGSKVTEFPKVKVNNGGGNVVLDKAADVKSSIEFVSGKIITTTTNLLSLKDNGTVTGASATTGFVNGPMKKIGDDAFEFPVGKGVNYLPIGISAPVATTDEFTAEFFSADPKLAIGNNFWDLSNISSCEYWNLEGNSPVQVTLNWNQYSCDISDINTVRVARWDGSAWTSEGVGGTSGSVPPGGSGTVTSFGNIESFGPFAVGFTDGSERYWIASTAGNWNDQSNWATSPSGSGGASVPGNSNSVFFSSVGIGSSTINVDAQVKTIDVLSSYSGTISISSTTFDVASGSAILNGGTFSGGSAAISIAGDLLIGGTSFTSTSGILDLKGDLVVNSGSFSAGSGTVTLSGTEAQVLSSPLATLAFYNLTMDKVGSNAFLENPATVDNILSLNGGILHTSTDNSLTLNANSSAVKATALSFISGPLTKVGGTDFTYHLGKGIIYQPVTLSGSAINTDVFVGEYFDEGQNLGNNLDASLGCLSDCEYWNINQTTGSSSVNVTLGWNDKSCQIDPLVVNMRVARWNSTSLLWENEGSDLVNGTSASGTVKADAVSNFGNFTLARTTSCTPENESYAVMKRKVDGSYYLLNSRGRLSFKFDEEYDDTDAKLNYKLRNIFNEVVASSDNSTDPQLEVFYGDNRYTVDFLCAGGGLVAGYYTLEVENEKKEKRFLRFKWDSSVSCQTGSSSTN